MPTVPYVKQTWTDGSGGGTPLSAARLGVLENGIFDLSYAPSVRANHNTTQSATSGVGLALAFNTERYDQASNAADTMHDNAVNNSRLTCRYAGVYVITANGEWAASVAAAGGSTIQIRLNGTTVLARQFLGNIDMRSWQVSTIYTLAVSDYVEVLATQNTGAGVNVASAGNYTPEFMMTRIG